MGAVASSSAGPARPSVARTATISEVTGLVLFHDYTSPASAVAALRLQRLADQGVPAEFEGFEAIGLDTALPLTLDVTAAIEDLQPAAAAEGLVLRRPAALPPTTLAHVVGVVAEEAGLGASWRATCYRAYWSEGGQIGERDVLLDLAVRAGLHPEPVASALSDRSFLAAVRRRHAHHRRNGVGGVPTILASRTLVPGLLPEQELRTLAQYA
jgi:2-hydroxychromene-2-carboxylate isomerase